jgi:hypothetical protein
MALAPARQAGGGGARFLDFGGFLRFLTRYRKEPSDGSRFAKLGFSFAVRGCRLPDRCPLLTRFARRITASRSRLPDRGARIADHGR